MNMKARSRSWPGSQARPVPARAMAVPKLAHTWSFQALVSGRGMVCMSIRVLLNTVRLCISGREVSITTGSVAPPRTFGIVKRYF